MNRRSLLRAIGGVAAGVFGLKALDGGPTVATGATGAKAAKGAGPTLPPGTGRTANGVPERYIRHIPDGEPTSWTAQDTCDRVDGRGSRIIPERMTVADVEAAFKRVARHDHERATFHSCHDGLGPLTYEQMLAQAKKQGGCGWFWCEPEKT